MVAYGKHKNHQKSAATNPGHWTDLARFHLHDHARFPPTPAAARCKGGSLMIAQPRQKRQKKIVKNITPT
jgi:hypothetical protein